MKDFVSLALTGSNGICKSSAPGRLWLHAGTYLTLFSLEKRSIIWQVQFYLMGFKGTLTPANFKQKNYIIPEVFGNIVIVFGLPRRD